MPAAISLGVIGVTAIVLSGCRPRRRPMTFMNSQCGLRWGEMWKKRSHHSGQALQRRDADVDIDGAAGAALELVYDARLRSADGALEQFATSTGLRA